MKTVVQRVRQASVTINHETTRSIGPGLMLLVGFEDSDGIEDLEWLSKKIVKLRIFNDHEGVMNLSLQEMEDHDLLVVSQFTLHASTKKGNRPSYIKAARPEVSIPLYNQFIDQLAMEFGKPVTTGEFGAHMDVSLINDGPVTLIIDTKNKE